MTNQEILEKAIAKAIDGGYIPDGITNITSIRPTIRNGQAWVRFFNNEGQEVIQDSEHVIFNHDFAKALWGDEEHGTEDYYSPKHNDCSGAEWLKTWEYHLKQMVIAEDPIKYLGDNCG